MKSLRMISLLTIAILMNGVAIAQLTQCSDQGVWTPQTFPYGYIDAHLLLTDGRVMAQYVGGGGADQHPFQDWYALTPTSTGTYINGSWSRLASLYNLWTPEYGPYSFASAVLKDGKVIVQGGEVNPPDTSLVWTTDGAIYNPFDGIIGSWSKLYPPTGWPYIGDAQSVVLQDGTYMVATCTTA